MTAIAEWQNFYVITGSPAVALIGLQFVVLSLITNTPAVRTNAEAGSAFATPAIVHFGAVLALSGILSAPWDRIRTASVLWGLLGLSGVLYPVIVTRRMRGPAAYQVGFG